MAAAPWTASGEEESNPAAEEADLQNSSRTEGNSTSSLQFSAMKSDDFLSPKTWTEGFEGQLLRELNVYALFPSRRRKTDLPNFDRRLAPKQRQNALVMQPSLTVPSGSAL